MTAFPEWLLAAIFGLVSGALSAGTVWGALGARLARVERDVADCVRRELYEQGVKATNEHLHRIERALERILIRLERDEEQVLR